MKPIVEDFKKHGYALVSDEGGKTVFRTSKNFNRKKIDPDIQKKHPIYLNSSIGTGGQVTIKSICGKCNVRLNDDTCPICGSVYQLVPKKDHIFHRHEMQKLARRR